MDRSFIKSALTELDREIKECQHCPIIQESGKTTSFKSPMGQCDLVFVGRNPGVQERDGGEPFIGRTKKIMDDMIFALGLTREQIHITNVLKCCTSSSSGRILSSTKTSNKDSGTLAPPVIKLLISSIIGVSIPPIISFNSCSSPSCSSTIQDLRKFST